MNKILKIVAIAMVAMMVVPAMASAGSININSLFSATMTEVPNNAPVISGVTVKNAIFATDPYVDTDGIVVTAIITDADADAIVSPTCTFNSVSYDMSQVDTTTEYTVTIPTVDIIGANTVVINATDGIDEAIQVVSDSFTIIDKDTMFDVDDIAFGIVDYTVVTPTMDITVTNNNPTEVAITGVAIDDTTVITTDGTIEVAYTATVNADNTITITIDNADAIRGDVISAQSIPVTVNYTAAV